MCVALSESCENGITTRKDLAKGTGKSPFSEYPDFSEYQMNGRLGTTRW